VLASAPSGQEPFGRSERVQAGHPGFDATQDSAETAHGAVQVYAITRMCARDEAAVAIHVTVAIRVRTARLPEGRYVYERQRFFTKHNDLFIDLKPWYLVPRPVEERRHSLAAVPQRRECCRSFAAWLATSTIPHGYLAS